MGSTHRSYAKTLREVPVSVLERCKKRFWKKVEKLSSGAFVNGEYCWQWKRRLNSDGYGLFDISPDFGCVRSHRFCYEIVNGFADPEKTLDHLCRNRACVNPSHLELVSNEENIKRGFCITIMKSRQTHCIRGHELIEGNLYHPPNRPNARYCQLCININSLNRRRV